METAIFRSVNYYFCWPDVISMYKKYTYIFFVLFYTHHTTYTDTVHIYIYIFQTLYGRHVNKPPWPVCNSCTCQPLSLCEHRYNARISQEIARSVMDEAQELAGWFFCERENPIYQMDEFRGPPINFRNPWIHGVQQCSLAHWMGLRMQIWWFFRLILIGNSWDWSIKMRHVTSSRDFLLA